MARKNTKPKEAPAEQWTMVRVEDLKSQTDYTDRLMATLELASRLGYLVEVNNGAFVVSKGRTEYTLQSPNITDWNAQYNLDQVASNLELEAEHADAAKRKEQLRQATLAKLTKEEREALGL